jgi:hypothetical protein
MTILDQRRYVTWAGEARVPAAGNDPITVEAARAAFDAPITWRVMWHYVGPGGAIGRAWVGIGRIADIVDFAFFSGGPQFDSTPIPAQELRVELVVLPGGPMGEHVLRVFIAPEAVVL